MLKIDKIPATEYELETIVLLLEKTQENTKSGFNPELSLLRGNSSLKFAEDLIRAYVGVRVNYLAENMVKNPEETEEKTNLYDKRVSECRKYFEF